MAESDSSSSVGIVAILAIMILIGFVAYFLLIRGGEAAEDDLDIDVDLDVPEVNMDIRTPGYPVEGTRGAEELGFFFAA